MKAVQYDPYRLKWEKRLLRYLSWQWRIRAGSATYLTPFKVKTLLDSVGQEVNWARLENALDLLERDKVIQGWEYESWSEEAVNRRGWVNIWLNANVVIEPPDVVKNRYQRLCPPGAPSVKRDSPKSAA